MGGFRVFGLAVVALCQRACMRVCVCAQRMSCVVCYFKLYLLPLVCTYRVVLVCQNIMFDVGSQFAIRKAVFAVVVHFIDF